jgi:hypothetical protein
MNLYTVSTGNDEDQCHTLYMGINLEKATNLADAHNLGPYQWVAVTEHTLRNDEYLDPTTVSYRDTFPVCVGGSGV